MNNTQSSADLDTRSRLLDAAGPVFAARGFDRATVREICASAGVNIASVGYHFGDKLGLYRELFRRTRQARERQFPTPEEGIADLTETLGRIVQTMMSRILSADASGWESQLFMREMQNPTPVFAEIVRHYFQPLYDRLVQTIAELIDESDPPRYIVEQLALSVIGQCVYYKVGAGAIEIMIPIDRRKEHFDIESLSRHITNVTLAAIRSDEVTRPGKQL